MKKYLILMTLIVLSIGKSHAALITLDFSTGTYNDANTVYAEDGFIVQASHGFHDIRLNTLAWYEGDNTITVSSGGGLFDLENLTIVDTAFAGLAFESSKGGQLNVGGISGLLTFIGKEWNAIEYFKITTITHSDILTEIDNISVTTVPIPPSALLMFSVLVLWGTQRYIKFCRH